MQNADIGLVGLAVMGENLAMNMESRGFSVAIWNRERDWVDRFLGGRGSGKRFIGCDSLENLCRNLKKPRRVLIMVRAGKPVDEVIDRLLPHMEAGDVIIDGGNSHYPDTLRRMETAGQKGVHYVGCGVSGGEAGALKGPCLMPGGSPEAWPIVKDALQAISARVDGVPCCDWVGDGGAGHFVKMVHNGIEYGDMQLICEAYQLMRDGLGMSAQEMQAVFSAWNETELNSYLIQITADILGKMDADGSPLLDKILDAAGQKGTGRWTAIEALNEGVPLTLISEAVFARCLSAMKEERSAAAAVLAGTESRISADKAAFIEDIRLALYASKIVSYAQGFRLMAAASEKHGWQIDRGKVALMWRGGCIIRSAFLEKINRAFQKDSMLKNLALDPFFAGELQRSQQAWRRVCSEAMLHGIPVPAFSAALSWYDGCRCISSSANLLQAQRDYFGAHGYERSDRPRGEFFHTDWTGKGGNTASGTYNV